MCSQGRVRRLTLLDQPTPVQDSSLPRQQFHTEPLLTSAFSKQAPVLAEAGRLLSSKSKPQHFPALDSQVQGRLAPMAISYISRTVFTHRHDPLLDSKASDHTLPLVNKNKKPLVILYQRTKEAKGQLLRQTELYVQTEISSPYQLPRVKT